MWMEETRMAESDKTAQDVTISPRSIDSAALFAGSNELIILHNGTPYRLRITRQDKLILTK
jgi:hemin uptake protein HemP